MRIACEIAHIKARFSVVVAILLLAMKIIMIAINARCYTFRRLKIGSMEYPV
jgi:hypothetical protein